MAPDVSPEMADLLRAGAADKLGLICSPSRVEKNYKVLREAERLGYLRFLDIERPWITPAGRLAIGAPTEAETSRAEFAAICAGVRKPLVPAKRNDPRTDFDYRSWKSMDWHCVLVVKQPHDREIRSVRVGRTPTSAPQYLGSRNSTIQPESDGRFVLAVIPKWLISTAGFSTYPLPLDDGDGWTDAEREAWDRLRNVCFSINSRIRNAGRGQHQRLRFGEFA